MGRLDGGAGRAAARARRRGWPASSASARPSRGADPRVRRGDVRSAILDVLRTAAEAESAEQVNGYQVIQQISERSGGAWRPSPGSVYPTIQQLQDEGLVETDDERGRKTLALTDGGRAPTSPSTPTSWPRCGRRSSARRARTSRPRASATSSPRSARSWARSGRSSPPAPSQQQRAAIDVLVETRRKLYGILADGARRRRPRGRRGRVVSDQAIRLSDAEREAAAADLGEHFAQGRLTPTSTASASSRSGAPRPAARSRRSSATCRARTPRSRRSLRRPRGTRYWNSGLRPFRRGVPTPLLVVLAVLIGATVVTHLPLVLLGFAVLWFVALRHRRPWHRRGFARHPGWR